MTHPKIVTLDIETSPIIAYVWSLWKVNVGLNQIIEDWSILSFCYKWLGQKQVHYHDCRGQGADVRNDAHLLLKLHKVLDEADIIVAQNGKKFDMRKINARFLVAGLPPPSPYKVVDTMLEAKNVAAFTSNRLEWLSSVLTDEPKSKHAKFPGFELWTECLRDNPLAWKEMEKYNIVDVRATEKLYLRLRPYIQGHPNIGNYRDDDEAVSCPKCGSHKVQKRGKARTQSGVYDRYQCTDCGGWSRSRYTLNSKGKRKALLAN